MRAGLRAVLPGRLLSLLVLAVVAVSGSGQAFAAGQGLRVGALKVDARLGTEFGFNSNVQANAGSEGSVAQLNLRPSLNLSTPASGLMQVNAGAGLGWRQYLLVPEGQKDQTAPDFGGIFALKFNPGGAFSFTPSDQLRISSPPNPAPTGEPITAVSNEAAAEFGYHPGGSASKARLGFSALARAAYGFLQYSNGDGYDFRDKGIGKGRGEIRYNFLPRTAATVVATVENNVFEKSTTIADVGDGSGEGSGVTLSNIDTTPIRIFVGGETLLSAQLEVGAELGTAFVEYGALETPSAFVANARATYYLSRRNALSVEYLRDFADAARYAWVQYDRLSVKYATNDQLFDASARLAASFRNFGPDQQDPLVTETTDIVASAEGRIGFKVAKGVSAGFRYVFETRSGSATGGVEDSGAGTGDSTDIVSASDLTQINEFTRHQAYFTVDLKY
jgi:hypothetical protein